MQNNEYDKKSDFSEEDFKQHKIKKRIKTENDCINPIHSLQPNPTPSESLNLSTKPNQALNFQIQEENPAGFYGQKKNITLKERTHFLATSDLRKFNNWIKSVLIATYAEKMQIFLNEKKCSGKLSILEIGCGKGGDLPKWAHHKIGNNSKKNKHLFINIKVLLLELIL